ncbi:hypothetical protein Cni_G03973 [Canna indica]|uniref:Uncharacterized protein n=1 Tax=Canna indica TaxID=4628 RepID=A0AAQ3JST3_9LILI|nr:hypothetical protein Cni_G03973 [Canna indica]
MEAFDREEDGGVKDEKKKEATKALASLGTASPSKNALLLLMRCRLAPHNRASSLATARFAMSPQPLPDPPFALLLEEDKHRDEPN